MENQKNNKGLVVLLVIFVILTLVLGGFILYDKVLSNENSDVNNNSNENNSNESIDSINFKFLDDNKNNKQYIVKFNENKYEVVYNLGENIHYIGIYNNKFYYSDTSIKYVDLNSENLSEKVLLEIPQPTECSHGCAANYISKSAIINDTLYFSFSGFAGGTDKYDGVLSISMNSNNFNDCKQIIADADLDKWYINEDNTKIYYAKFNYGNGVIPYEYNIQSGNSTQLSDVKYISDIMYNNGKLLYYFYESDRFDANWNKIYSCNCIPHYELYIYDVNNKNIDLITKEINENKNGNLTDIADMINGKIYYYTSDGKIHQYNYNTKSSSDYYSVSNNSNYRGFNFIDENTMKIHFENRTNQLVVNGKNVDSLDEIKITMLDNSVETFTIENLK